MYVQEWLYCSLWTGGKYEPAPYVVPPIRTPSPQGKGGDSPTKNKREKGKDKSQTPEPVSQVMDIPLVALHV